MSAVNWQEELVKARIDFVRRVLYTIVVTVIIGFVIAPKSAQKPDWTTYKKLLWATYQDPKWIYAKAAFDFSLGKDGHDTFRVDWLHNGQHRSSILVPPAIFATGNLPWEIGLEPMWSAAKGRDSLEGMMRYWDRARLVGCWYMAYPDTKSALFFEPVSEGTASPTISVEKRSPISIDDAAHIVYADIHSCPTSGGSARDDYCRSHKKNLGYVLYLNLDSIGSISIPVHPVQCLPNNPLLSEALLEEAGLDKTKRYTFQEIIGDAYYDAPLVDNLMEAAGGKALGSHRTLTAYTELIRQISEVRERVAKEKSSTQLVGVEMSIQLARVAFPWFMVALCALFLLGSEGLREAKTISTEPFRTPLHAARNAVLLAIALLCGLVCGFVMPTSWVLLPSAISAAAVALSVRRNPNISQWLF